MLARSAASRNGRINHSIWSYITSMETGPTTIFLTSCCFAQVVIVKRILSGQKTERANEAQTIPEAIIYLYPPSAYFSYFTIWFAIFKHRSPP